MTGALDALTPVQRLRRVRRLLREVQGQRALLASPRIPAGTRAAAEGRIATATADALAELILLEETGVMEALDECFVLFFRGPETNADEA